MTDSAVMRGQWRLSRIEVVNWGTFDGAHRIDVARQGHLFTGASGSGKSSLLDAVAAVITPDRWLRFNAAAQDASSRSDDRGPVSYVRGAWSKEEAADEDRTVSTYLRKRATWSGILLRYDNLIDAPVLLVRMFHMPGASSDRSDLKDMYVLLREDVHLDELAPFASRRIDARGMKKHAPDAVVTTSSHKAFFTRMRRLLGIANEGALQLLHRTQSAKNLGSLDQLFRGFMLDYPSTFKRAKNATEQFGELREAHRYVVELRRQLEALDVLGGVIAEYESADREAEQIERLQSVQAVFQERFELRLAETERAEQITSRARAHDASARAARAAAEAREMLTTAERQLSAAGGSDLSQMQLLLDAARSQAEAVQQRWDALVAELRRAEVASEPKDAQEFAELQEWARRSIEQRAASSGVDHSLHETNVDAKRAITRIESELAQLRSRRSNIPAELQARRNWLCEELELTASQLPFAGELISVREEHVAWTGAIERVLRPFASTLVVRDQYLSRVRRLIDQRHLGIRLVLESVPRTVDAPKPASDPRSLVHRVDVASGPFHDWVQQRLSASFDIVCVDSPDELDQVSRGVTIAGQAKLAANRYEKNDRRRIDDRSEWILGSDNDAKIELLLQQLREVRQQEQQSGQALEAALRERDREVGRIDSLRRITELHWESLDRDAVRATVTARQRQIDVIASSSADLAEKQQAAQAAREQEQLCRDEYQAAATALALAEQSLTELKSLIDRLAMSLADRQLDVELEQELDARYRAVQRRIDRSSLSQIGLRVTGALGLALKGAGERARTAQAEYTSLVTAFGTRWAAAAASLTTEIGDRSGYLALRDRIRARGLPEHEDNFFRLLQEKSRDLIGHILDDLRSAPGLVAERIEPVNASLARSPFDDERFLRIQVKTKRSSEVTEFLTKLRTVADGSWNQDDRAAAEQRYAALEEIMDALASDDSATQRWRQRVLDTREHVTFLAHEVDLAGRVVNVHDSSAGLSGGQRQKLVIFCLAAALRYQLTSDEEDMPTYGTIVLDEAFDKADSRYTRMAMHVFVEFGFHMILATPQKLLQTLEPYLGAVTSVSNPTRALSRLAHVPFGTANSEETIS